MILGERMRSFEHEACVLEGRGTKILHQLLLRGFVFLLSVFLNVLHALTLEIFELRFELSAILVLLKVRMGIDVQQALIGCREFSESVF